jgi:hypothetical protein
VTKTAALTLTAGRTTFNDAASMKSLDITAVDTSWFKMSFYDTGNASICGGINLWDGRDTIGGDLDIGACTGYFRDSKPLHILGDLTILNTDSSLFQDTVYISGDLTLAVGAKLSSTVFTFIGNGVHTITTNGVRLQKVKGKNLTFVGSVSMIPLLTAGGTVTFGAGTTDSIRTGYSINGSAGNLVSFRSGTTGTRYIVCLPAKTGVAYMDFRDCGSLFEINADPNSINSGNNSNISFYRYGAWKKQGLRPRWTFSMF